MAAHGVSGRAELVPLADIRHVWGRIAAICRAHDRRAIDLHRRHERLGHLPDAGGFRTHAGGLHPHGQLPAARRRRALGAAGAGGAGHPAAARFPAPAGGGLKPDLAIASSARAALGVGPAHDHDTSEWFVRDSSLEGNRIRTVWGFWCQVVVFGFAGSLFGGVSR